MPDAGIPAPYLDPSQYPGYLDMERKQALAQMLMQNVGQVGQTPQNWDNMRLIPRTGLLQGIAPVAAALLASKGMKNSMKAQQSYFQGLYGAPPAASAAQPTSAQPPPGADPGAPNAATGQPSGLANPADIISQVKAKGLDPKSPEGLAYAKSLIAGAASPNGAPDSQGPTRLLAPQGAPQTPAMGSSPQAQGASQGNPMLLTGDQRTSQALLNMMGQQEYGKALAGRYAPTDMEKTLRAAGIDPTSPAGRQALLRIVGKEGYIAPVGGARPGTIAFDPLSRQPLFAQPDVGHNVQLGIGQDGQLKAAPIPGNVAAQAGLTGAETAAKVVNTPQTFPTSGGGSTVGYPSDVLGAPPALRGFAVPPSLQQKGGAISPQSAPQAATPGGSAAAKGAPEATPWAAMPKLKIGTGIGAPDAFTEGRLKAAGTKDAELSSQYGQEADLADQKQQYNAEAMKVLPVAEAGPMSNWLTENRAKLLEFGVPSSLIPGDGTVTPTMELNKFLKNTALQGARQIYGSRMTQTEVKLQTEEMSPSASMTHDAIQSLIQQDNIKNAYAKQRAGDYGKFIDQGGDPLKFESWYSRSFPLNKFAQSFATQNPASATSPKTSPRIPAQTGSSAVKPWEMTWK